MLYCQGGREHEFRPTNLRRQRWDGRNANDEPPPEAPVEELYECAVCGMRAWRIADPLAGMEE